MRQQHLYMRGDVVRWWVVGCGPWVGMCLGGGWVVGRGDGVRWWGIGCGPCVGTELGGEWSGVDTSSWWWSGVDTASCTYGVTSDIWPSILPLVTASRKAFRLDFRIGIDGVCWDLLLFNRLELVCAGMYYSSTNLEPYDRLPKVAR